MTDVFLDELRADWRRRAIDLDEIRRRAARRRLRMQAFLAIEIAGVATAVVFAIWLVMHALTLGIGLAALGALAMLISTGLSLWTVFRLRAPWLRQDAEVLAPKAALHATLTQLDDADRVVRYWLSSAAVLILCAAVAALLVWMGLAPLRTLVVAGSAWLGVALALAAWGQMRKRRIADERAAYIALLRDYDGAA
jgi:hypothetical protein